MHGLLLAARSFARQHGSYRVIARQIKGRSVVAETKASLAWNALRPADLARDDAARELFLIDR